MPMQTLSPPFILRAVPALLGSAAALLAGCASGPAPAVASAAAAPSAQAAPAAAASAPAAAASAPTAPRPAAAAGAPPAFAEVTRDAKRQEGFLDIWSKEEKTWIEIPAARLNQPFFFASALTSGLGERFFWPGLPASRQQVAFLRRVGNQVQLVARNYHAVPPKARRWRAPSPRAIPKA